MRKSLILMAVLATGLPAQHLAAQEVPPVAEPAPQNGEQALFREADEAIRRGDQEWALDHLQKFLQEYSDSPLVPRAQFERGVILEQQERTELATQAFEASIQKSATIEDSIPARLRLAAIYALADRFEDTLRVLGPVSSNALPAPQAAEIRRLNILAFRGLGRDAEAHAERLGLWQVLRPGGERTQLELGLIDEAREVESEERVEQELRSSQLPPFYESALLERLLELKLQAKNLQGSLDVIERYFTRFPGDPRTRLMETRRRDLMQASQIDPKAIGVLLPLSAKGALGMFAARARKAIEVAVKHTSAQGGGVDTVRVIVKDTAGSPQEAVKALNDLASAEKVVAVIGPIGISEVKAAAQRASELGLPMLALSPLDDLPGKGSVVFRMLPTANEQISALVEYARTDMGLKNFAVLYPDSPLGEALFGHYVAEVERLGGRLVGAERYDSKLADFKLPLHRLTGLYWPDARRYESQRNRTLKGWSSYSPKRVEDIERAWIAATENNEGLKPRERSANPPVVDFDALFIAGTAPKVGLLLPQITFREVKGGQILGFSEWNDPELFNRAGGQAEGSIIVDGFSPQLDDPRAKAFVADFLPPPKKPEEVQTGPGAPPPEKPPAMFEARAYDAVGLIADAARRLGIASRTGLALRLSSSTGYAGLGGRIRFHRDGRPELPLVMLEAKGREFIPLDR